MLTKHLSYSDLGRAQNAGPTESAPLRAKPRAASDGSRESNVEPEWYVL